METAVAQTDDLETRQQAVRAELGPVIRMIASRYFESVRFPVERVDELARLHEQGFVVHVMRTTAWINFIYLTWALITRGLPPVRAVVNLRRWLTRPWRKTAQRGDFEVRFTYARRNGGSGLIFLRESAFGSTRGKRMTEDPFPALVEMARKGDRPVFLVPELFVWEKRNQRLKPALIDYIFGSPEAPGFLHTVLAFWRNYKRAQFRVGTPIDLGKFIAENPNDSDELLARKVRSALHHHLARETRAVFGAPYKTPDRVIDETLRDRVLNKTLEEQAKTSGKPLPAIEKEARRNLNAISARLHPTVVALAAPLFNWVFNRIYDGIEVDENGLEQTRRAAAAAPIVLCPSHKSHIDYLVMSTVMWNRGYNVPLVAAGANLSFFPLGIFLRRGGAFFLRRSFKGDAVYTAAFRAYIKRLVHDGVHQEFFPEGGRSRTGKLLAPKLGMLSWEVDAVLEGARQDLHFVPVSIDYEKVVESSTYSKELAGGEKKPEDLKALLSAPKVLSANYGRIHLSFDTPISLVELMASRGLSLDKEITEEQKRGLVRALGNRIMYGISRVSTVTPHALVSTAVLAHRRRGITSTEVSERVNLLRRIAMEEGAPLSTELKDAPSDPTVFGGIAEAANDFIRDEMLKTVVAKNEVIYQPEDNRRSELAFYKNTLMNMLTPRSLVANAVLAASASQLSETGASVRTLNEDEVKSRALFLSRLFKFEFIYKVNATFDSLFVDTVDQLVRLGLITRGEGTISIAPESHSRPTLGFLADLMRDYLESYLIAALTLRDLSPNAALDKKALVKAMLETGRAEFLAGRLSAAEALSRTTLENALAYLIDQKLLVDQSKKLAINQDGASRRDLLVSAIRSYVRAG
ncbi:MAG: 1-acyl-sn-glycerol-3-phosphate acyltransferase [Myxococcaceae bacterium]